MVSREPLSLHADISVRVLECVNIRINKVKSKDSVPRHRDVAGKRVVQKKVGGGGRCVQGSQIGSDVGGAKLRIKIMKLDHSNRKRGANLTVFPWAQKSWKRLHYDIRLTGI